MKKNEWFADWFDTTYYHILYKNRDEAEAKRFINNLTKKLNLPQHAKVLDLACGKGRHSITLHELGFDVLGLDLSSSSIAEAQKSAAPGLRFDTHDMREVYPEKFDAIFNLFTSFGYFDTIDSNIKVIQSIHSMLKNQGILVIDFMNAKKTINELVSEEVKEVDGITFHLTRKYDGEHIFKNIQFEDKGKSYSFTERVQVFCLSDFESLLTHNNFEILLTFGNFDLDPFDEQKSDRLIIVAQKK